MEPLLVSSALKDSPPSRAAQNALKHTHEQRGLPTNLRLCITTAKVHNSHTPLQPHPRPPGAPAPLMASCSWSSRGGCSKGRRLVNGIHNQCWARHRALGLEPPSRGMPPCKRACERWVRKLKHDQLTLLGPGTVSLLSLQHQATTTINHHQH